jgi:hypothetical protein
MLSSEKDLRDELMYFYATYGLILFLQSAKRTLLGSAILIRCPAHQPMTQLSHCRTMPRVLLSMFQKTIS